MENNQFAQDIIEKLKEVVRKGNVTRIEVGKDGKIIANFPLTAGVVVGVAAAPWAILLAVVATIGANCSVDVIKEDGDVIHIA